MLPEPCADWHCVQHCTYSTHAVCQVFDPVLPALECQQTSSFTREQDVIPLPRSPSKTVISAVVVDKARAQPPELASNSRLAPTKGAGPISRQCTHLCNVELTYLQLASDRCSDGVRCAVGYLEII